jgi:glycosyltransferase involved in cell wall biosynthesis
MRLMILTADYPPAPWSGIGVAVERQARALAAMGVEVHVLVGRAAESCPADAGPGLHVHSILQERCPVDPAAFDWIHLHSLALSELALELHTRYRIPLAYTVHSIPELELPADPHTSFWQRAHRALLRSCAHTVFLSHQDMRYAWNDGFRGRWSVIPNGITPLPAPPPYRLNGPVVFAGRFAKSKGIELLESILDLVCGGRRINFVLAGGHGDDRGNEAVGRMLSRYPSRCRSAGWLPQAELEGLLATASLVLVPSYYEPFGLVALEAMRAGAPVLAAKTGGLAEMLAPGSGGRLVESWSASDWAAAITTLLDDEAMRCDLSRRGPQWVAGRYHMRHISSRMIQEVYTAYRPRGTAGSFDDEDCCQGLSGHRHLS